MTVDNSVSIPDKCPVCGREFKWSNHCNAVDLCGIYFVGCDNRGANFTCRWCMVLDFRE